MLLQDVRYGARTLRRAPGFTLLAVLAMSLGIGSVTAVFSIVDAALLKPLRYRDASRLVMIWDQLLNLGMTEFPTSPAIYEEYRARARSFEDIAAFRPITATLTHGDLPERIPGASITANLPEVMGASVALGRPIASEENQPGRPRVVLLSDSLWRRRFGADPGIIGRSVSLDGAPHTVIGVMTSGFRFRLRGQDTPEIWTPLVIQPEARTQAGLRLVARIKSGVTVQEATAEMKAIGRRLADEQRLYRGPRGEDAGYTVAVVPLRDQLFGPARRGLWLLLGATALVLLIACANVAHLLIARGSARQREIAVRQALGAGRRRIVAQLATEGVLLSLLGAVAGIALAFAGVNAVLALRPPELSVLDGAAVDLRVLTFALLLSLVTGVLFGLAPAVEPPRLEGRGVGAARREVRLRDWLIAAEAALALTLAIGAGLFARSLAQLEAVDPGFVADRLLTARISLPTASYAEPARVAGYYDRLIAWLRAQPEIESAGAVSQLPLSFSSGGDPFSIEGRAFNPAGPTPQFAHPQTVSSGYFSLMRIPIIAGRDFEDRDSPEAPPVAIINRTLAEGFWPREIPIGKRVVMGAPRPGSQWMTIVGVAGDVRSAGLVQKPIPQIYTPYKQRPSRSMALVLRTRADPARMAGALPPLVARFDREQPVYAVATMRQLLADSSGETRFRTLLLGVFGALAFVLAAIGLYGVVSYAVTRRAGELALRAALGARPAQVVALIVRQAMLPVAVGVAIGVPAALALARLIATFLYGISPADPITYAGAAILFGVVAAIACCLPAWRAVRVDPASALRCE